MTSKNYIGKYQPFDHIPPGTAKVQRWWAKFEMKKKTIYDGAIFKNQPLYPLCHLITWIIWYLCEENGPKALF